MKQYVFSFKDNDGKHLGRFEGKNEAEAWQALLKLSPDAEKLAGFEVDETLDKLLDAVKYLDDKSELDELAAHKQRTDKAAMLDQFKANVDQFRRQKTADAIEHSTLQRGAMEQHEWNTLTSSMSPEEKKALYDEFMADADKNHADQKDAALEKKFINYIFGIKEKGKWNSDSMTVRDIAELFGISHVRVLAIQKAALAKLVNNIAKLRHYPFKITSAEEAIALLLADNVANPEELKLKTKVNGNLTFEDALKRMAKMEKERKAKVAAMQKADNKKRRDLMAEFKRLEKETNELRDKLKLPRRYERFFKFFKGQKMGNWS